MRTLQTSQRSSRRAAISPPAGRGISLRTGWRATGLRQEVNAVGGHTPGCGRTFLERDLPELGIEIPSTTLHRFWRMLAHYHGQLWNGAELARAFGVSATTVRRYLDLLTGALVVRQLPPWFENLSKRQVRSPKVYIADTGLLAPFSGSRPVKTSMATPRSELRGRAWFLVKIISRTGARPEECYFWAAHAGAELDLLVVRGRRRLGFEVKRTTSPAANRSLRSAREPYARTVWTSSTRATTLSPWPRESAPSPSPGSPKTSSPWAESRRRLDWLRVHLCNDEKRRRSDARGRLEPERLEAGASGRRSGVGQAADPPSHDRPG